MKSDLEIAQAAQLQPILEIAQAAQLQPILEIAEKIGLEKGDLDDTGRVVGLF